MTPGHLLVLVALGLWLGQTQPPVLRWFCFVFAPVSALGLGLTAWPGLGWPWSATPVFAALGLGFGLLIALQKTLPPLWHCLLLAACALSIALDSPVDLPVAGAVAPSLGQTLLGTWLGLQLVPLNLAYYSSLRPARLWASIGLRVLGSWIVAISLLLLAFAFRR